jgi:hypothetical protein
MVSVVLVIGVLRFADLLSAYVIKFLLQVTAPAASVMISLMFNKRQ